jgi:membrane peptidoglycan carboxypeptidase
MSSIITIVRQRRHRRDQTRSSAQQRSQRTVLGFGFAVSAVLLVVILATALVYADLTRGLPPVEELAALLNPRDGLLLQPTRLYDRTGQHLLATLAPNEGPRVYVLYSQFPKSLVDATVASAQPNFWSSPGYVTGDWRDPEAHPTLAQGLVYNLLLWDDPASPLRAIHERMLAAQVTARYGREQVLEWVLNSADYGYYAYGAEAAAQLYLGKSVAQINLGEAALLAAISQAPALNPIDAPQAAEQRRIQVIQAMLEQGLITSAEYDQAISNPPSPLSPSRSTPVGLPTGEGIGGSPQNGGEGNIAPAFVNFALSQLDADFGAGRLERGGLTITTTLDYDLQLQAVCAVQTQLARLAGNNTEISAADGSSCEAARLLPALQSGEILPDASASALLLDPQTGQILAAVGDMNSGIQSTSLASHPAGTTITPFVYLTGFSRGLNPASLGWDIPGSSPALGQVYHGPVRLRTALANDYLPPATYLLDQMGQDSVQNIAASFGLDLPSGVRLLQDDFNISPLSLAKAYGIFANSGTLAGRAIANGSLDPAAVLQVSGVDHSVWADWTAAQTRLVVSPQLAYLMNHVLSDETARWPSLGHPNPLEIGRPAGAKLAQTLDQSAAWTAGYTPQRVAVVWLGAGKGLAQSAGEVPGPVTLRLSADLWHALIQYAVRGLPSASWDMPSGIVTLSVCDPSGLLPTTACPNVVSEIFLEGRQPVQADNLYQTFQINTETGLLATVFTPPELVEARTYLVMPAEARAWAKAAGIPTPPTAYDTLQGPPILADVHISTPEMFADGRGEIEIRGSAAGADFVSYRLEYGQGLYPQAWTQIGKDSATPVTEGLLGKWDTSGLNGLYALRLMVVRTDQRVEQAVVQVTLDNTPPQVAISYPQDAQEISATQEPQVALQAQVNDPFLAKVEFYVDGVLVGESDAAPFGVVWEAKVGKHTLRVVATDRAGNATEAKVSFTMGK